MLVSDSGSVFWSTVYDKYLGGTTKRKSENILFISGHVCSQQPNESRKRGLAEAGGFNHSVTQPESYKISHIWTTSAKLNIKNFCTFVPQTIQHLPWNNYLSEATFAKLVRASGSLKLKTLWVARIEPNISFMRSCANHLVTITVGKQTFEHLKLSLFSRQNLSLGQLS